MMSFEGIIAAPKLIVSDCLDDDNSSSCSQSEEVDRNPGKDSGIDCEPETFVSPDDATTKKIREIVEFYFSDDSILKSPFLLKHVRRNKEGFVSLKLVSSFRKVRNISHCWKTLVYSLRSSEVLVLNKDETKVARKVPLPDHDETSPSKSVIAFQLPNDKEPVESAAKLFSGCGDITVVRVLQRGCAITPDIKRFYTKHPEVQSKDCVLMQFAEFASAQKALALDSGNTNGLRVLPFVSKETSQAQVETKENISPKRESPKKKKKAKKSFHGSKKNLQLDDSESDGPSKNGPRSRRCSSGSLGYCSSSSSGNLSTSPADNWFLRRHSYHPAGHHFETSTSSFASLANRSQMRASKGNLKQTKTDSTKDLAQPSGSQSPWRRRRELVESTTASSMSFSLPVRVTRLPRGPDGTKGFPPRNHQMLPSTAE